MTAHSKKIHPQVLSNPADRQTDKLTTKAKT